MARKRGTTPRKRVSVAFEVHELQRVLEGLTDLVAAKAEGDPKAERITATLGLVAARLRDLGRVLRGTMALDLFWTPQNAALAGATGQELVLVERRAPGSKRSEPSVRSRV